MVNLIFLLSFLGAECASGGQAPPAYRIYIYYVCSDFEGQIQQGEV